MLYQTPVAVVKHNPEFLAIAKAVAATGRDLREYRIRGILLRLRDSKKKSRTLQDLEKELALRLQHHLQLQVQIDELLDDLELQLVLDLRHFVTTN